MEQARRDPRIESCLRWLCGLVVGAGVYCGVYYGGGAKRKRPPACWSAHAVAMRAIDNLWPGTSDRKNGGVNTEGAVSQNSAATRRPGQLVLAMGVPRSSD